MDADTTRSGDEASARCSTRSLEDRGEDGTSKDKVISVSDIRLWQLSDRFLFPTWFPIQVAFSIGDVFIALGAFWFFWSLGGPARG
jgi:hypothetical protein